MRLRPRDRNARGVMPTLVVLAALLASCGGGSDDWYYHWACNGDPECLGLNPTGAASGTLNEGPEQVNCTQLMEFASRFWNMPPATNACDHSSATPPPALVSITISPANPSIPVGLTRQFTATGHYSDGSTRDLTAQVRWDASLLGNIGGTPIATITAGGLLTASAIGSNTLVADLPPLRGTTRVNVTAASIQAITVAPASPTIPAGTTQDFTATGHLSDGSTQDVTAQCTWTSGATAVATVAAGGRATGVAVGATTITATRLGVSGSATLNVGAPLLLSIGVSPAEATVPTSYTAQFRATGGYSDGSTQDVTGLVTWTAGTPDVASVTAGGLATGLAVGTSAIQASSGAISGGATLTVSAATLDSISVLPADPLIGPASTVQLTAVGTFSDGTTRTLVAGVTWNSALPGVATVDPGGLATGVAVGSSTVTATVGGLAGSTVLGVTLTPPGAAWTWVPSSPVMVPCNTSGCAFVNFRLTSVTWSGRQFVAVGSNGGIYTSPDGITWATRIQGPDLTGTGSSLWGVAWSPPLQRFVAVGLGYVMTSSDDGVTWTPSSAAPISGRTLNGVIWAGTQFVAVGNGTILTSPDGVAWTDRTAGTGAALRSVAWTGSKLLAVGDVALASPDGVQWRPAANGGTSWTGITWTGSQFVEVGSTGAIRTSPDGASWVSRATQPMPLDAVTWTGTQLVAVGGPGPAGSPGYVVTSPDGVTWTSRPISADGTTFGVSHTLLGVAWSGTTLLAVGDHYYVYASP
jgi:Big-like domain-containing protein